MQLAPSPKDVVHEDGTARLLRFPSGAASGARLVERSAAGPVLLVPSLINRWYVLDLRRGASVVEALTSAGLDVFCLDWGEPNDEDRYLDWDAVLARLARAVRRTSRIAGAKQIGLLGYCIGGTLSAIHTALEPEGISGLVNLAGPIDFAHAGFLGHMTNPRWFDPEAIASAGNMGAAQMQAGFMALRPTSQLAKVVAMLDKVADPPKLEAMQALDTWASDNIAFPAAAYVRYIKELYQSNQLVKGEHRIRGRRVDLASIRCPLLTVTTTKDAICPPPAALALNTLAGSSDVSDIAIPGGHVGAVIGEKAKTLLYPQLAEFFSEDGMQLGQLKVIVTGAGRGMGAHFARRLDEAGAMVAAGDIDEAALETLPASVHKRRFDVSDEADCASFVGWANGILGGVNALVNNAGILRDGLLVKKDRKTGEVKKLSLADWNAVIGVNLTGATMMVREVVATMVGAETRPGVIVNISSISRHGNRGQSNYVAAKAALAANTVTWAKEFAAFGIRVAAIAPGMIETPMTQGMNQAARDALVANIPAGRIGLPEDIWQAVKFVFECDYVTARTYDVDGGLSM